MMHIGIVLAAVLLLAPVSRAEEPADTGTAVTTTTLDRERVYGRGRAGEPASLPTGLPGFGTPGLPVPEEEKAKAKAAPAPPADGH
jgi:hypothetical protein